MVRNRFSINLGIRVILITFISLLLTIVYTQTNRPATTLFLFLMLIYTGWNLFYYVNRTNRQLANFIVTLKEKDTSAVFSQQNIERSFRGLTQSFKVITDEIQQNRFEKESERLKLQIVVEQVGVGLISINREGVIEIFNRAAEKLLNTHKITEKRYLDKNFPEMGQCIDQLIPGIPTVFKLNVNDNQLQLSLKLSMIRIQNDLIRLISLQDIREELEAKELDTWKRLIRTITHEIMNSITPITTLTTAIKRSFLSAGSLKPSAMITSENIADALQSVGIIEDRSKGLIHFVERYKQLTRLPAPQLKEIKTEELLRKINHLFKEEMVMRGIAFSCHSNPVNLSIIADEDLIEQVLINLVKNAIDAIGLKKNGKISLLAYDDIEGNKHLQVTDNGQGIPPEVMENLFTPFFTTKEKGSGIGLSLARQIMKLHKGIITVNASSGKETVFTLQFHQI
jgi:two-component system, NtrC family, nitrogen regulation sensor histidine kinase NtrY